MAEVALKKLEERLNCAICLDTYIDPKLLQCFHVFCRECLVKLVVRDQQGQLILACPSCRQATSVPANGVAGLQSAFQTNELLEVLEEYYKKKAETSSPEEVMKSDMPTKKGIPNCLEHADKERELYCETCSDLICWKCAIKGGMHQDHDYQPLKEAFERYKEEIAPSLAPMEEKLEVVEKALVQLDKRHGEVSDQQATIEADIHNTAGQLHEMINMRSAELIDKLHQKTQGKLKNLAVQRDEMETTQAQLSSCVGFVKETLQAESQGKILTMKASIVKQVNGLTPALKTDELKPNTENDLFFSALPAISTMCQTYGEIGTLKLPDPLKCHTSGKGLEVATVEELSTAVIQVRDVPCLDPIHSFQCELVSEITGASVKGNFKKKEVNLFEVSYQPTVKGKHHLSIKVKDGHIRGSPFTVRVIYPVQKLGTPITKPIVFTENARPSGMVVSKKGEMVIMEFSKHCVSIFSPRGERLQSLYSGHGEFHFPCCGALDSEGNIFVTDSGNDRIQKFTADFRFIDTVGIRGNGPLQFYAPKGITFNVINNKVYVADTANNRIQVLNPDLTYFDMFGESGSGTKQFKNPWGIACDSTGKVYVVDNLNHRIQVFTSEGVFSHMFERDDGQPFGGPVDIAIDGNDVAYVSDHTNSSSYVCVLTLEGRVLTSFGRRGGGIGEFYGHHGLTVDSSGVLYVCDYTNDRVQIF